MNIEFEEGAPEANELSPAELPEYLQNYEEDVEALGIETDASSEEKAEIAARLDTPEGMEKVQEAQEIKEVGPDQMAEAMVQSKLSMEDITALQESYKELMASGNFKKGDSESGMVMSVIESHFMADKEQIYDALKYTGILGPILSTGESVYYGYKAVAADSSEERNEYIKAAWDESKKWNPVMCMGEAAYRTGKIALSEGEDRQNEIQAAKQSCIDFNPAFKWVLGNEKEQAEAIDTGKALAVMFADAVTLGTLAEISAAKGGLEAAKFAGKEYTKQKVVSEMFTSRLEKIKQQIEAGESVTSWDLGREMIQAGMEVSDQSPEDVMKLMGETMEGTEYLNKLPEKQRATMQVMAEILQNEKGQAIMLEKLKQVDGKIQERKKK
ncbi:MAG: hypothetical protein ABH846_04345 [Patescibacteria group bacterium]